MFLVEILCGVVGMGCLCFGVDLSWVGFRFGEIRFGDCWGDGMEEKKGEWCWNLREINFVVVIVGLMRWICCWDYWLVFMMVVCLSVFCNFGVCMVFLGFFGFGRVRFLGVWWEFLYESMEFVLLRIWGCVKM